MIVTFKKTVHFAPFGDERVEKYSEGAQYKSRGAHESRMFAYYIEQGYAVKGDLEDRPVQIEKKIVKPKTSK